MFDLYGKEVLNHKVVASIGAKTTARIKQLFDLNPLTAKTSTAKDTIQALLKD
jgi:uroporphyrinogen-III synthase